MPLHEDVECGFAAILKAALAEQRCPTNNELKSGVTGRLAAEGRILVEVYPHNYRVIEIVCGPHAGARTRAPDNKRWRPYKVIQRKKADDPRPVG